MLEPPVDRALSSFPLDVKSDDEMCRLAVDRAGSRHLLVPVVENTPTRAQRGSELVVEQRWLVFGAAEHSYLDISCARPDLYREFDKVIVDVVAAVRSLPDPRRATLDTVARWRRLFRLGAARGLSAAERRGLFAELICLRELVQVDARTDIGSWTGPLGLPHDFELRTNCLEVKAAGAGSDEVRIHGLDQLDTHDGKPLHLVVMTLVEDQAGESILELVEDLTRRVDDPALVRTSLTAVGWTEDDPFVDERYTLGPVTVVPVTAHVPRLVAEGFIGAAPPDGISRVDYSIDRSALLPHASSASLSRFIATVVS